MNRYSWSIFLALVALNMVYNTSLPLLGDEAYYWAWSRQLDWSYFDHPPMIAWMIKAATLLGDQPFFIRLVPVTCMAMSGVFIYKTTEDLFCREAARKALLIFLFTPLAQLGFVVATPDAPLVLFWTATLYYCQKAIFDGRQRYFYYAGVASGFLLLSKYTGFMIFPGVFLGILVSSHRSLLRSLSPYAALTIGLLLFAPVVYWNAVHEWVSFAFQFSHGVPTTTQGFDLIRLLEYVGGQMGLMNPIFFVTFFFLLWRNRNELSQNDKTQFLFWSFAVGSLFFLCIAGFKLVEANWPAPLYAGVVILLAGWLQKSANERIVIAGAIFILIAMSVLKYPEFMPNLPAQWIVKDRVAGYDALFRDAAKLIPQTPVLVISDHYIPASLARYYLPGHPEVQIITPTRRSQYNYWRENIDRARLGHALYIGSEVLEPELRKIFGRVEAVGVLNYNGSALTRRMAVYECFQYRGDLQ